TGQSHLVREVEVTDNAGEPAMGIDHTQELIDRVGYETLILRRYKIAVPEVQYHPFRDDRGRLRVLARIGIIDGVTVDTLSFEPDRKVHGVTYREAKHRIGAYRCSPFPGLRLCDIGSADQYMLGQPRDGSQPGGMFLIDLEPM